MNLTTITNLDIPSLQIYRHMRDNVVTKDNSFIADSPLVVNILLDTSIKARSLLATRAYYEEHINLIEQKEIPNLYIADKKLMETIVGHRVHHNVMMHGIRPAESSLKEMGKHIVMLDSVSKNDNVGAIARSAAALGVNSYVVPKQGPHPYGRKALRVSMGYVSKLQIHTYNNVYETLETLKNAGYRIFAAENTKDAISLKDVIIPDKWVLLMGHEAMGISLNILRVCDEIIKIDMAMGINSFNVGVAASILMYQFKAKVS